MENRSLTEMQAFMAMYSFLEYYYGLAGSDDIGGLLGGMYLLQDGSSADPAIMQEWQQAVNKALRDEVNVQLAIK